MDKEFLERCLADGMSLDQIAKRSGKHPSTVSYWVGKHGLSANGAARHAPKGGLTREELEPLVEEGLTIERIAQRLGIGDTTVRHWLKRHGLKTVGGQRRDALAYARLTGQERFELRCRRHGLVEHVVLRGETRLRCTKCRAEAVARRRRKVKAILVAEAGGKCVIADTLGTQRAFSSITSVLDPRPSAWVSGG